MSATETISENHERRIAALEAILPAAALDLIYRDPHSWSTRGCPTCRPISEMIGQDFGCVRYAKEQAAKKRS